METSANPLLALVDATKNDIKSSLKNYSDLAVDNQIGKLKNDIMSMFESGEMVFGDVNAALVSAQPNANLVHSTNQQSTSNTSSTAFGISSLNEGQNAQSTGNQTITEPVIKQEGLGSSSNQQADFFEVKDEFSDDDDDEGEYMSDCDDECEDCVNGICGLVRENDNADNGADAGMGSGNGLNQDVGHK